MHKILPAGLVIFFLAIVLSTVPLITSPLPYELNPKDMYTNLVYQVLGRQSESESQAFVDDILAQAENGADTSQTVAYWDNKVLPASAPVAQPEIISQVLQASEGGGEKWIEIDLSEQKLYAHEGENIVYEMKTSTGKKWTPTPTGEFRIWIKVRKQKMSGGSKATGDYYYLPNVPHVMFFYKGYGIHGAYWHNNFGKVMSHGCVNLSLPDAEKLYNWADPVVPEGKGWVKPTAENPGTRVVIHE